eukprot:4983158-Lingulodinium_polyedra.AAC.1
MFWHGAPCPLLQSGQQGHTRTPKRSLYVSMTRTRNPSTAAKGSFASNACRASLSCLLYTSPSPRDA